jgi:hypothetical protein
LDRERVKVQRGSGRAGLGGLEGFGGDQEVLALLSGEEEVGELLAAKEVLGPVAFDLALHRFLGTCHGAEPVARMLHLVLGLLLVRLATPNVLFFLGHLVPVMACDAADMTMVALDIAVDLLLGAECGAKDHERVAGPGNALGVVCLGSFADTRPADAVQVGMGVVWGVVDLGPRVVSACKGGILRPEFGEGGPRSEGSITIGVDPGRGERVARNEL